jgi:hypothetical protein
METGIELIAKERQRQIDELGYTVEGDAKEYNEENGISEQLAEAAACYATPSYQRELNNDFVGCPIKWPWMEQYWKPTPENRIKELIKAGALIAAEIDRLQHSK